ncbi:MAG: hypothetical protein PHH44_00045 [bacterium]|nr:hypothetical protein [bacterium]
MKQILKTAVLLFFLLLPFSALADEAVMPRWGVGLNYPGAGIKYLFNDKLSLELRGQFVDNIVVGGLRGNYYFNPESNAVLFMGIESDYVSFKGEESKGHGFAGELYLGIEFFLLSSFSLQADFGPAFITLTDQDSDLSVNGIEYVVNFGVNWYFGSQDKEQAEEEEIETEEEEGYDE